MFAIYNLKGILDLTRPWRIVVVLGATGLTFLGGFRSNLILIVMVAGMLFFVEKLYKSRLLPILILVGGFSCAAVLPFSHSLPLSAQRVLSFIPGVQVDAAVAEDAKGSADWRFQMWARVIPEIPSHLLLGKGYALNASDIEMVRLATLNHDRSVDEFEGSLIAGDYHSGPLSVILPFGIWGVVGVLWFWAAGIKVLYRNFRYGLPALQKINTFLFAYFLTRVVFFLVIFGSLYSDFSLFTGLLGLSVCFNKGVRAPVRAPFPARAAKPWNTRPALAG